MLQAQRKAFYSDDLLNMLTSTEELHGLTHTNFWEKFAAKMTGTIQQIIEFAKLTPGFNSLDQDDQIMVLKGGEISVLQVLAEGWNKVHTFCSIGEWTTRLYIAKGAAVV